MTSPDSLLSRNKRRSVFAVLVLVAVGAPVCFIVMAYSDSGFLQGYGYDLLRVSGGAHALLLVWCALFIGAEPVLARCALIYIALLHLLFLGGVTRPVF